MRALFMFLRTLLRMLSSMHMFFRTFWHLLFVGSRGSKLGLTDVSRSNFRVWPTDLDILGHMNNGKYLSIMDVARFDLTQRNGVLAVCRREKWYPVIVGQTISYRKSLNPWKRFTIESRVLGVDEQAVYLEQRFLRPGADRTPEIYARAIVRTRILRRSGGVVRIDELLSKLDFEPSALHLPEDVLAWGLSTRLPSTRDDAQSVW